MKKKSSHPLDSLDSKPNAEQQSGPSIKPLIPDSSWRPLSSGIIRDFNAILLRIMFHAKLIEKRVGNDTERQKHAPSIISLAQQGKDVVDQIIELAKEYPDAFCGQSDITQILNRTVEICESILPKSIELKVQAHHPLPPMAAIPMHVEQAVLNLVLNAGEALEWNGQIQITADLIPFGKKAEKYVRIRVADQGCGIAEPIIDHACEPFFSTKSNSKTSGLGLAITKRIATENKGHLAIHSISGRGTHVDLYLPPR